MVRAKRFTNGADCPAGILRADFTCRWRTGCALLTPSLPCGIVIHVSMGNVKVVFGVCRTYTMLWSAVLARPEASASYPSIW